MGSDWTSTMLGETANLKNGRGLKNSFYKDTGKYPEAFKEKAELNEGCRQDSQHPRLKTGSSISIQYRVSRIQPPFSLTYKAVICKQHLAGCSNQVSSFNAKRGKEDLKWSMVTRKPRYSEEMESGVLYPGAKGKRKSAWKRYGAQSGNRST